MIIVRKSIAAVAVAGSMLAGGVAGAVVYGAAAIALTIVAFAATTAARRLVPLFVSNGTAAHVGTERAARDASEMPAFPIS